MLFFAILLLVLLIGVMFAYAANGVEPEGAKSKPHFHLLTLLGIMLTVGAFIGFNLLPHRPYFEDNGAAYGFPLTVYWKGAKSVFGHSEPSEDIMFPCLLVDMLFFLLSVVCVGIFCERICRARVKE